MSATDPSERAPTARTSTVRRILIAGDTGNATPLRTALEEGTDLVVVTTTEIDDAVAERLVDHLAPGSVAASSSPLSVDLGHGIGVVTGPTLLAGDPDPLAPSIALPDHRCVAIRVAALRSDPALPPFELPWPVWCARWSQTAARLGWSHVACPDVVAPSLPDRERLAALQTRAARRYAQGLTAPANRALERAETSARSRLGIATLALDARLLRGDPRNGTEQVMLHLAIALAAARPDDTLHLLTDDATQARARLAALLPANVRFVGREETRSLRRRTRHAGPPFDIVYRPVQLADLGDLRRLRSLSRRLVLGQLDTISHANLAYHSTELNFFSQRNVFHAAMALADGVVVISDFVRRSVLAEAPSLEEGRLAVIPCGSDGEDASAAMDPVPGLEGPFALSIGTGYAHKNRPFTLRVFSEMGDLGFPGTLVLAGAQPPFGGIGPAERRLIEDLRSRGRHVLELRSVDASQRRWLLANASVVLYPSVVEGFGLVPFEAAAYGTPTVTAGGSAIRELLGPDEDRHAWDARAMARRALALVDDPDERARALAAVADAGSRLRWSDAAAATWAFLDHVASLPLHAPIGPPEGGSIAAALVLDCRRRPATRIRRFSVRLARRVRRTLGRDRG